MLNTQRCRQTGYLPARGLCCAGNRRRKWLPHHRKRSSPGFIEEIKSLSVKVGRLEAENEHLRTAIEAKQREIEARQREIEDKGRQIKLMRIDHLKKEEPDIHTQYLEPAHAPLPPENPVESAKLLKSQPQEALFTT